MIADSGIPQTPADAPDPTPAALVDVEPAPHLDPAITVEDILDLVGPQAPHPPPRITVYVHKSPRAVQRRVFTALLERPGFAGEEAPIVQVPDHDGLVMVRIGPVQAAFLRQAVLVPSVRPVPETTWLIDPTLIPAEPSGGRS